MDLENLLKCLIEKVQDEGAENINKYELMSTCKGFDLEIEGKKFEIRVCEK